MRINGKLFTIRPISLCSPVFNPQMTEGACPPGLVTENESVRHCPNDVTSCNPVPAAGAPFRVFELESEAVEGPAMLKVLKSKRSWKVPNGNTYSA